MSIGRLQSGSESSEILRLRKELVHTKTQVADLQEELEEKTNLYIKAISDRDQFREKLSNAKESINKVENIVQSKVNLALDKERKELARLREENDLLRKRLEMFDAEKLSSQQREKQLQDKINGLTQDLQFYARNSDMQQCMQRIEKLREERDTKDGRITEHLEMINTVQRQMEDLAAENRTLRKMAAVPDNYGIDLASIKLHQEKKIENYTRLIKVLQDDNYKLEEERARLKHMLKQQSMLYTNNQPWDRYPGLTPEDLFKVDQFVLKLQAGQSEEPADFYKLKKENTVLKAQLEALNSKGFEFAKSTIDAFLKELGLGGGDSGKLFDKLQSGNDELKKMIRDLVSSQGASSAMMAQMPMMNSQQQHQPMMMYGGGAMAGGRFRPPQPNMGIDGEISTGFSHKFQAHLEVADKDGRTGLGEQQTRYDVAFLQLQLQETFELIKRKDEELSSKNIEIDSLYKRVRDYLLIQDQLYKDYVHAEKDFNKSKDEQQVKLRNATDSWHEEQRKVEKLQTVVQTLQGGVNQQSLQARLIELTKQNSLLDINLLRLTRKYQSLAEQEDLLRREFHNREADLGEKDRFVQQRINSLKEWKARAIQQLKFLFTKLRLAVPRTEFESAQGENELLKQRNADYIERNSKLAQRASKLQTQVRENLEAEERMRQLQESRDDLENEYEVVRKRLEQVDPAFRWENAVFNKIVAVLKKHKISPKQAFDEFDKNKDGKLTRDEFMRAMELLKISDISQQEMDVLLSACDYDSDGFIRYKEFVRKLSRHGVKSRTAEEQILYLLIESLRRSGIKSLADAFELFDKERRGSLSRDDFKDVFKNMKLRIEEGEVDKFIDHFWRDQKAGIDYEAFLRIFQRYQLKLEEDESRSKKGANYRVPDDIIRLKKRVFTEVNSALVKAGKRIDMLFKKVDIDGNNVIDLLELKGMFEGMKIKLTEAEVQNIFSSIDFDMNGAVSFPEFITDFNKTVKNETSTLLMQEKERYEGEQALNKYGGSAPDDNMIRNEPGAAKNQEMQMQTRIAILETREKQMTRKLETSITILNHSSQSQIEVQKQYDQLEKRWNELTEQFHMDKQKNRELQEQLRVSIKREDARKLQEHNEQLQTDLTETRAAMLSYKNMNETVSDQVKGLKLILERRKDENENLITAVRELSSQSDEQKRLGKLYYLVMLSRWQEAALSRKYDSLLNENREIRKELINTEQLLQNKEIDHHRSENSLQETLLTGEKLRKQIADSKNVFLTLEKAEEFNGRLTEITEEKTALEEQYFQMRSKYRANQLTMDDAMAKAENAQELLDVLQRSKQSDLGDRMIALSDRLQSMKLGEMRAVRELNEVKEKNNYISRLLRTSSDSVKTLEQKVAEFESRMSKRDEEFRRADNERMRRFFNARFDDIPGALNQGGNSGDILYTNASGKDRSGRRGNDSPQSSQQQSRRPVNHRNSDLDPSNNLGSGGSFTANAGGRQPATLNFNSSGGGEQSSKFFEGKIRKLEIELNKAVEDIRAKDSIINRFKEWQLADKYLSEDEVLRDAIENQRTKVGAVHDQESKEMAEAAAQMVKTLQDMLDSKNESLRSKDDQIQKLRDQMMIQSEQDGVEIGKLRQQLSLAAGTTLAKLQEIVVRNDNKAAPTQTMSGLHSQHRYEKLTREELSRNLEEKDQVIGKQARDIAGLEQQLQHMRHKNQELDDRNSELQSKLEIELQHTELKSKVKELERIRKELLEKDKKNENLRLAIDKLNERMQQYEIQKSGVTEDQKMSKMTDDLKRKEHDSEMSKIKSKLVMLEASKKLISEDLKTAKIKEQELLEQNKKLVTEKEETVKNSKLSNERLTQEIRHREKLQIELSNLSQSVNNLRGSSAGAMTYEQLLARVKELENENIILKCQMKAVVVYNKEFGTFEYISNPIPLEQQEITDIEDFINSLRKWLNRTENQSLTVRSIFESLDLQNFGELNEAKFETALRKVGVDLRAKEKRLLKDILDPRNIGFMKYKPILRELQGVPQLDFISNEVVRLAKSVIEARDLDEAQFKRLIDPKNIEMMTLVQLQENVAQMKNEHFSMSNEEVELMFKSVAKCQRTVGVTLSITKLSERAFKALDALLIERMADNVGKSLKPLSDLVQRHDSNKDGQLEYTELENMLLECQLAFKPHMFQRICTSILDGGKRANKVTFNTLKFYLLSETNMTSGVSASQSHHPSQVTTLAGNQRMMQASNYDIEPSKDRSIGGGDETSQEELNLCRTGARKIIQSFQSTIVEALNGRDRLSEGLISREDLQRAIEEQKVPELTPAELILLLKLADKGNKGYIATGNFIEKLQELVTETKSDVNLRTFAMNCKRQAVNLKLELFKYDTSRAGRLDKRTFAKAMSQLPLSLADDAVDLLFQAGESQEARGTLDIKFFIDRVVTSSKYNALQNSAVLQLKTTKLQPSGATTQKGGAGFESWEVEKKYKTKLSALQQQIEESKKETQAAEKQGRHWQEMASRFEKEKNSLQTRLVDYNAKPPRAQTIESNSQAQVEQVQQLRDQVFYLQEEGTKLEKKIQVDLKSEVSRQMRDNEKLTERNRNLGDDVRRLEQQIGRLLGKADPMDPIERREEGELWRQNRIQDLEAELNAHQERENDLEEQLFKVERVLLDLKFQKETFDLQYARLQKRITDLEQYKLASSKYSSVLQGNQAKERDRLEETAGVTAATLLGSGPQGKKEASGDSVKLRQKSSKSVAELEMLVESLKRVIERQKAESDALKKQIEVHEQRSDKLKSEKQLRQRIESLEQELHSYEMKDVNVGEKDRTIKKLIDANRLLSSDLEREMERFTHLENKHKDLLNKFSVLAKENAKYADMRFTETTGAQLPNFSSFLGSDSMMEGGGRTTADGFAKKFEGLY